MLSFPTQLLGGTAGDPNRSGGSREDPGRIRLFVPPLQTLLRGCGELCTCNDSSGKHFTADSGKTWPCITKKSHIKATLMAANNGWIPKQLVGDFHCACT